jgi:uncharacterized membrane protein SirB2
MFSSVPKPFWVLFFYFAYDDILRWFSSPFWLSILIFLVISFFFLKKNGKKKKKKNFFQYFFNFYFLIFIFRSNWICYWKNLISL